MTPLQKQILRERLLRQLDEVRRGVDALNLCVCARNGGFKLSKDEVEYELEHLVETGLVRIVSPEISQGVKLYKITGAGTNYLEANC